MNFERLTNKGLAAIALYQMGAAEHAVDTEDLAMKLAELAPQRFRWKRHQEQIDIEAVRMSVKHLREDDPPLAAGGVRHGWMLTPEGIQWCASVLGECESDVHTGRTTLVRQLRQSDAYKKFKDSRTGEITDHDVRAVLKVDEYSSTRRRKEKIQAVKNAAASDQELSALVTFLVEHFPKEWT